MSIKFYRAFGPSDSNPQYNVFHRRNENRQSSRHPFALKAKTKE